MKYTTRIKVNGKSAKRPPALSRPESRGNLRKPIGSVKSAGAGRSIFKFSKGAQKKIRNVVLMVVGIVAITLFLGGTWVFAYLQQLSQDLPPLDDPFRDREIASIMYDRKGKELYKLIGDYARDPVDIKDIPEHVKWAFLAAEDVDFYNHQGFDPASIFRCAVYNVMQGVTVCGGSTITQQASKITVFGNEQKFERKLKELLLAMKIEQAYSKDEILQLYLTVAPFGGQIYGITSAADFYFNKQVQDLTLAEASILASIVQNPAALSPTKSVIYTPEDARIKVKERQGYVLGQVEKYRDKINSQTRSNYNDPEMEDVITVEMIEAAHAQELVYAPPILTDIKAGHFVDFVRSQLTTKPYKYGEPFTETELLTGGYRIYTTLDYDLQQVAEAAVADAVATYGPAYNVSNGALLTISPARGEIITMVGSKSYFGQSEGCDANGHNCRYNPQVNILTTPQSPGSSTKPYATYEAYRQGKLFTGSFVPDVPINEGNLSVLKNWNGSFYGATAKTFASQMLAESRNLPAVITLEAIGIPRFLEVMRSFGYSTYTDDAQYGHSVVLGGSDVLPIEHARGYGALANQGDLVENEAILKITDKDGNIVWEYTTPNATKVADERAAYMLNMSLLNNNGISWDGRDVSMKTGTSQDNKDVWVVPYSPDMVTVAWMGNNNNEPMDVNAFGESVVTPWLRNYMRNIGDTEYFAAARSFERPAGVITGGGCESGDRAQCVGAYVGLQSGYMLEDVDYPVDNLRKRIRVCKDQPDRVARPIDEALNMAEDRIFDQYVLTSVPNWQRFVDEYITSSTNIPNGGPTAFCDRDRGGSGIFVQNLTITSTATGVRYQGQALSSNGTVNSVEFYFSGRLMGSVTNGTFDVTYPYAPAFPVVEDGVYAANVVVRDNAGSTPHTSSATYVTVGDGINNATDVSLQNAGAAPITRTYVQFLADTVNFSYSGAMATSNAVLQMNKDGAGFVNVGTMAGGGTSYSLALAPFVTMFPTDGTDSTYTFRVVFNVTGASPLAGTSTSVTTGTYTVDE